MQNLCTLISINNELVVAFADCANGTLSCTESTTLTLISIDNEVEKLLTYACGALLINNVSNIFITEVSKCRNYGVRSSLTEAAERVLFDVIAKSFKLFV